MKNIFLLRHAHAVNNHNSDFDRNLSEEGILKCQEVASILAKYLQDIDLILSSPTARTKQTIENILSNLAMTKSINYYNDLYGASAEQLHQQIILNALDNHQVILVVAHNPGISELGRFLAQNSSDIFQGFFPGSLALFQAEIKLWQELDPKNVELKNFWP